MFGNEVRSIARLKLGHLPKDEFANLAEWQTFVIAIGALAGRQWYPAAKKS
jgi:hypothetical protein